jgi:peptidoglycan/xylan/chitin deacetylase (PgdA/CDA1 family)
MGCINLHKGRLPEYRGMPPAFWELYDGQTSTAVTVHCIDDGLDTGDIVGEAEVEIHPRDTEATLRHKLDLEGSKLLARCVADLAQGVAKRDPQPPADRKARTAPTHRQRQALDEKLGQPSGHRRDLVYILKTIVYLLIYYAGVYHLVRAVRSKLGRGRVCALLYHRVNNLCQDTLTTCVERFAEHMVALDRFYAVVSTADAVEWVQSGEPFPNDLVVIHFDDCYKDVYTTASHILQEIKFTACVFVASGFVGTQNVFPHDIGRCPFMMENLDLGDLAALVEGGFQVGAHTVNHANLALCDSETLRAEVTQCKHDLEQATGKPIDFFSYPFGRRSDIRPEAAEAVRRAGYKAMFSAYGGCIYGRSDLFDLQRTGVDGEMRALDLIMEIEGLSVGVLKRRVERIRSHYRRS